MIDTKVPPEGLFLFSLIHLASQMVQGLRYGPYYRIAEGQEPREAIGDYDEDRRFNFISRRTTHR